MLVLSRRPNESIRIGSNIQIKLLQVRGNQVTLGIAAPAEVAVDREEVYLSRRRSSAHEVPVGVPGRVAK